MAMTMKGKMELPASREVVWEKLNDPEALKASIPGCQSLEKTDDATFVASVKLKVGPIGATFKGRVELTDLDPPNGYRIVGQGDGGLAGFAKGGAEVQLSELDGNRCLLSYAVDATIGGKIAQLGSRLVDGVAKKTADQFFANFSTIVTQGSPTA